MLKKILGKEKKESITKEKLLSHNFNIKNVKKMSIFSCKIRKIFTLFTLWICIKMR